MSNVRVVTDSTADIPEQLRQAAGIEVVPLSVLFGTEAYKDKVEISHDEFIQRLKTVGRTLPTTAAPSPGQFEEVYSRLADEGAEGIVSVHLSEKLSGTIAAARIAAESVADRVKVEMLDSRSISLGLGFLALEGARIAAEGGDLETVAEAIRRMAPEHPHHLLRRHARISAEGRADRARGGDRRLDPLAQAADAPRRGRGRARTSGPARAPRRSMASCASPRTSRTSGKWARCGAATATFRRCSIASTPRFRASPATGSW